MIRRFIAESAMDWWSKWIDGRLFDHYSDAKYREKPKEFNILPIKSKLIMTDLVLFYKIIHSLISIQLPEGFCVTNASGVKNIRNTANIVNRSDITNIRCSIRPKCDSFRNSFFIRTMNIWNKIPFDIRQVDKISLFKTKILKFLWTADVDWPDKN